MVIQYRVVVKAYDHNLISSRVAWLPYMAGMRATPGHGIAEIQREVSSWQKKLDVGELRWMRNGVLECYYISDYRDIQGLRLPPEAQDMSDFE